MPAPAPTDLSLLETQNLLDELERRFDDFILAGVQHRTKEDDAIMVYYKGSLTTCIGLSNVIASDMSIALNELRENED